MDGRTFRISAIRLKPFSNCGIPLAKANGNYFADEIWDIFAVAVAVFHVVKADFYLTKRGFNTILN